MVKKGIFQKKLIINFIIFAIFIIIAFVINKIPNGYIIAGGDFHQEINFSKGITSFFYMWNDAGYGMSNIQPQNLLFFFIQFILFRLGLNYAQIANTIMFLFLICSFYSFYFSLKIFDKENNISYTNEILLSGIYSLNNFTLSVFTYSWGYGPFFCYIFSFRFYLYFLLKALKNIIINIFMVFYFFSLSQLFHMETPGFLLHYCYFKLCYL